MISRQLFTLIRNIIVGKAHTLKFGGLIAEYNLVYVLLC